MAEKRDAVADLAICAAAIPGPLCELHTAESSHQQVYSECKEHDCAFSGEWVGSFGRAEDAAFMIAACDALPHWIERAKAAERECLEWLRLARVLNDSRDDDEKYRQALHDIDEMRLGNGLHEVPEPILLQLLARATTAEAEVARLRAELSQTASRANACDYCGGEGGFYADWDYCPACNGTGSKQTNKTETQTP